MASGKKNYFRHDFNSRNNHKVQALIKKFGVGGYYYYFSLVEMIAQSCSDEFNDEQTYHQSRLYTELRLTHARLILFLTYAQGMSMLEYTYLEPMFNIRMPKLAKFMGKYNPKGSNKTKLNEIKEKKIKLNKDVIVKPVESNKLVQDVINHLNNLADKKYKSNNKKTITLINARNQEGYELKDFIHVIDVKIKSWIHTDMEKFLRPETLFGGKFENYLNENKSGNGLSKVNKKLVSVYEENPYVDE